MNHYHVPCRSKTVGGFAASSLLLNELVDRGLVQALQIVIGDLESVSRPDQYSILMQFLLRKQSSLQ